MKGFIIFEDFKKLVNCEEILDGDYNCVISDYPNGTFGGIINRVTGATCNKDDTYDFEVGALIALMKMCGVDKVVRACNEAFSEDTFKTYATKYERELNTLKKDFDKVRDLKEFYKKNYGKLGDRNKYLIEDINKKLEYIKEKDEEIKKLKSDKDKSWKNYQRNIQKKQDRINELQAQIKASEDDKQKNIEYYEKEIKNLNYRLTCRDVRENKTTTEDPYDTWKW